MVARTPTSSTASAAEAKIASELLKEIRSRLRFLLDVGLTYLTLDENEAGVWDQQARAWKKLEGEHRASIKKGLRIARKQTAPDLIRVPVPVPEEAK